MARKGLLFLPGFLFLSLLIGCGTLSSENPFRTSLTVNAFDSTTQGPRSPVTLLLTDGKGINFLCVHPINDPNVLGEGCLAPPGSNQPGNNPVNAAVVFGPLDTGHYVLSDVSTNTSCDLDVAFFTVTTTPPPPQPNACSVGGDGRTVTITISS